jgi:hypothetical protein
MSLLDNWILAGVPALIVMAVLGNLFPRFSPTDRSPA